MSNFNIQSFSLCAALSLASFTVSAEEQDSHMSIGKQAHQDHCYKCHSDDIYTREDRVVKSISALGKQVRRCKDSIGIPWFDEDTDAVVEFLNEKYYKF